MDDKRRILLVDGNNLLFQMFFGMPARIKDANGIGIWGVLGFVGALLKIFRYTKPTHVAVLFDGEHENPRNKIYAGYKSNRVDYQDVPEEDNPYFQLPWVYASLDYLGIAYKETIDCEVDDWIAGYVSRYGVENEIIISSFDSDFFQLLSANVKVFRYRGKKSYFCGIEYLRDRFGIEPWQYADFKSLVGDSSDHINGVRGIGPKTAAALLREFGSLSQLIENAVHISNPRLRTAVLENTERLLLNDQLIRLSGYAELPFELSEMEFSDVVFTTWEVLHGIGLK